MKKTIALVGLLALSSTAHAMDTDFTGLDADQNGALSFEEFSVLVPDLTIEDFTALDVDASGTLSEEEFKTYLDANIKSE